MNTHKNLLPFDSHLFKHMVSTPEMVAVWTDDQTIESWMEVERAIVETQCELGLIPEEAARAIKESLSTEFISPERIYEEMQSSRHLIVSFIKTVQRICPEEAEHFHLGPTSQDILDTGLTLQLRKAHELILTQATRVKMELLQKAEKHKDTVMMGRTHQQHAVPTTLGFVLATWAVELNDHISRCKESEKRWLFVNLSGAVGNQNAVVELAGLEVAEAMERRVAERLHLKTPPICLHSRIDRFGEILRILSFICSSLARMALNIRFWCGSEVGEIDLCIPKTAHSSSTMPNKENPEECELVAGIATLVRQHSRAVDEIQIDGVRDSTRIPVLLASIPQAMMLTSKALSAFERVIVNLKAVPRRMRDNLQHQNVLGQAAAERLMIAAYKKTGKKLQAHERLHACAVQSRRTRTSFRDQVRNDAVLGLLFDEEELDAYFDLTTYLGNAVSKTEQTVRQLREKLVNHPSNNRS